MAKENEETKPEGTVVEETEEEESGTVTSQIAAEQAETEEIEAELEAGASDTVSRAELLRSIKRRQAATKKARELQAELDNIKRTNETESQKAVREAEEKVQKSLTSKYLPALIKTGAEAALLAASPKKGKAGIPRLIKLMDLDAIEVNDELELEGVEEEVERLKEEFPELFGEETASTVIDGEEEKKPAPKRRTTTTRSQDGASKKAPEAPKLSTSELIMRKLRGDD